MGTVKPSKPSKKAPKNARKAKVKATDAPKRTLACRPLPLALPPLVIPCALYKHASTEQIEEMEKGYRTGNPFSLEVIGPPITPNDFPKFRVNLTRAESMAKRVFPDGVPEDVKELHSNGIPEQFLINDRICTNTVHAIPTAKARFNAEKRLERLAYWYTFASASVLRASYEDRAHRPRIRALARILRATLLAHLRTDDASRAYLKNAEDEGRRYLTRNKGTVISGPIFAAGGDIWGQMHPKNPASTRFESMLLHVVRTLENGANTHNDINERNADEKTAKLLAQGILQHYDVFIDRLKEPAKFASNKRTAKDVADAIKGMIGNLDAKEWPTLETAKSVIRAALRVLDDKNPDDFFSNFDKQQKKLRAQMQNR